MVETGLRELVRRIARALDGAPTSQAVGVIRAATQHATESDDFLIELSERALFGAAPGWVDPWLHRDPERRFAIRLFYWRPRQATRPHVHAAWTVTGVLHNELTIQTYRYRAGEPLQTELVDRVFAARRGDVSSTTEPTLHDAVNPSGLPSIALQIGALEELTNEAHAIDEARTDEVDIDFRRLVQTAHVVALGSVVDPRALALLERLEREVEQPIAALAKVSARRIADRLEMQALAS